MLPEPKLPDPLPDQPMSILADWFAEAMRRRDQPNPNAVVLATCVDGRPSARVVLCKDVDPASGTLRFYTNYESRKGRELAANPRAALVFHWDHLHRQVRLEGAVEKTSAADSDAYFASRPRDSQLGAHASRQSEPIESMAALCATADQVQAKYAGHDVPRPSGWGGYALRADTVELWVQGAARLHERVRWTREPRGEPARGAWRVTRLQP